MPLLAPSSMLNPHTSSLARSSSVSLRLSAKPTASGTRHNVNFMPRKALSHGERQPQRLPGSSHGSGADSCSTPEKLSGGYRLSDEPCAREAPAGSAFLANQDRWVNAQALDVGSLHFESLGRGPIDREPVHGWCVRRQGRWLAIFRWEGRLQYVCGERRWDIEKAQVRRRAVGPLRSLSFEAEGAAIGTCRWLDWELARRWFIPKWADVARDEDDAEHYDWSLFIEAVLTTDRRDRIGRRVV